MPRRLSLAILLGLITTAVLSFGITAGAAPGGGTLGDDETAAAKQRLAEIRTKAGSAAFGVYSALLAAWAFASASVIEAESMTPTNAFVTYEQSFGG